MVGLVKGTVYELRLERVNCMKIEVKMLQADRPRSGKTRINRLKIFDFVV